MTGNTVRLADRLTQRDRAIVASVERFRLLSTRQVQRLHFAEHATAPAAARAANRTLQRLRDLGLIAALQRRIGGVRRGSASYVWQLAAAGERLLRAERGLAPRRRFTEPSALFVDHTLAVADVAVGIIETARTTDGLTVKQLGTEPNNWRTYVGPAGETRWLKPDLHVVTNRFLDAGLGGAVDLEEEHAFLEIDLGTEHRPAVTAKCQVYATYMATGAYQAANGLFPTVIWLAASASRRTALREAVYATPGLPRAVFHISSPERYLARLASGE
jgi:hypothetical protein